MSTERAYLATLEGVRHDCPKLGRTIELDSPRCCPHCEQETWDTPEGRAYTRRQVDFQVACGDWGLMDGTETRWTEWKD